MSDIASNFVCLSGAHGENYNRGSTMQDRHGHVSYQSTRRVAMWRTSDYFNPAFAVLCRAVVDLCVAGSTSASNAMAPAA
jgi:hypothetical protein